MFGGYTVFRRFSERVGFRVVAGLFMSRIVGPQTNLTRRRRFVDACQARCLDVFGDVSELLGLDHRDLIVTVGQENENFSNLVVLRFRNLLGEIALDVLRELVRQDNRDLILVLGGDILETRVII